jgi:ribonuclease HI
MNSIDIITDGACSGNPGRGGWAAIVIDGQQYTEYSGADAHTTNNRMELQAAITGLQQAPTQRSLRVITDSQYLINGITKWVKGWQKNGWKTREGQPVENRDLWELLITVNGPHVSWQHVKGHAGHPLNERANTLAQQQAGSGTGSPLPTPQLHTSPTSSINTPTFPCYLSLIGSTLQRHATWESCQHTVHGVSGAKFKKVANQQQLDAQLQLWKVRG